MSKLRLASPQLAILQSRLREVLAWEAASPEAGDDELWSLYDRNLREPLSAVPPELVAFRVLGKQNRATLCQLFIRLAEYHMRTHFEPTLADASIEAQLWELALCIDDATLRQHTTPSHASALHRLVDLWLRLQRNDIKALSAYIELFAPHAGTNPSAPSSQQDAAHKLLAEGAVITVDAPASAAEISTRLGCCLRLRARGYSWEWIGSSINYAQIRLDQRGKTNKKTRHTKRRS